MSDAGPPRGGTPPRGSALPAGRTRSRPALRRFAELLALTAFAVAQPVLDVTGPSPEFFLFRRPSPTEMRLLVLLVAFGPALYLWAAERAVGLIHPAAEPVVHRLFAGVLCGVLAVQAGKQTGLVDGVPFAVVFGVLGAALALRALRFARIREVLAHAAPAPLVFLLVFTLSTPSGVLVRPTGDAALAATVAARRPPVVVIVLDELPARALLDERGDVDARLFPAFARLAARSTRYPKATAVSGLTARALPSMLTGRYPAQPHAPSYVEYPDNLFTLLGRDYRVEAYESISQLCPPQVCTAAPPGRDVGLRALIKDVVGVAGEIVSPHRAPENTFESFADEVSPGAQTRTTSGTTEEKYDLSRVKEFVAGLRPGPDPTLHFLHLLMPHVPYRLLPSGRTYPRPGRGFPVPTIANFLVADDPELAAVGKQRLLLQTAYADALLGRVIDRLEDTGLWDDALVVVTADHGAGLEPGAGRRTLNDLSGPDVTVVPLFVKEPGQREGRVDRRNAEVVDVLPTVADVLGIDVPWAVEGGSLLGPPRRTRDKVWHNPPSDRVAFTLGPWARRLRKGVGTRLVDADRGARGLFAVGPLGELVGRPAAELPSGPPAPFTATLDPALDDGAVTPGSRTVPAMLWGDLDAPVAALPDWLAVTVNGVVAGAVAVVEGTDGDAHFLGMADDTLFDRGANDVALHVVDAGALRAVPWAG